MWSLPINGGISTKYYVGFDPLLSKLFGRPTTLRDFAVGDELVMLDFVSDGCPPPPLTVESYAKNTGWGDV